MRLYILRIKKIIGVVKFYSFKQNTKTTITSITTTTIVDSVYDQGFNLLSNAFGNIPKLAYVVKLEHYHLHHVKVSHTYSQIIAQNEKFLKFVLWQI